MFKRLPEKHPSCKFTFNDEEVDAVAGDSLAAALLASGLKSLRSNPVSKEPRAPFCMMGACFECLVEVDGQTQQACMVQVKEGMSVRSLTGIEDNIND